MSEVLAPALAKGPLGFLPASLLEPRRPVRAVLIGWLIAAVPALLLAALVQSVFPNAESPQFAMSGWSAVFLLSVFAPFLESIVMGLALTLLLWLFPPAIAIVLSAAGWAVVHSLAAPAWGLVIWWPFLIFSTVFVVWRTRGFFAGVGMATAVHGLNNLIPALAVAFAPALAAV
jgi:hypothetical protein